MMLAPIAGLSVITVAMTFAADPLYRLTLRASEQLLNPELYIDAVLKGGPHPLIFGNLLLALAWAALNGSFTLESLLMGLLLGRLILLVLAKGAVLPVREVGRFGRALRLIGYLAGKSSWRTSAWLST